MFAIGLLNADLPTEGLHEVQESKLFRLSPSERVEFEQKLPAYNAFVADLNLVNVDSFRFLTEFQEPLASRISAGALLVCFTSRPNLHSPDGLRNKYSWLPLFDPSIQIREDLVDKVLVSKDANGAADAFNGLAQSFYATCSFPQGFGTDPYEIVLRGDDGTPVGLLKRMGTGAVLLVPQCEEKRPVLGKILEWWSAQGAGPAQSVAPLPSDSEPIPAEGDTADAHGYETVSTEFEGDVKDLVDLVPEAGQSGFGAAREELDALLEKDPTRPAASIADADKTQKIDPASVPPSQEETPVAAASSKPHAWLDEFKGGLPYLSKLIGERTRLEGEAHRLLEEASAIQDRIDKLSSWDTLLCGDAGAVTESLIRFFPEILRMKALDSDPRGDPPSLKVRSIENQFLIHVIVGSSPAPEKAGRELLRALADADADTKGLLVVNGAAGSPPPKDAAAHFAPSLIKLAEKRGILLVSVASLYRIGLASAQEEGWQAEPIVEALAGQDGFFDQF